MRMRFHPMDLELEPWERDLDRCKSPRDRSLLRDKELIEAARRTAGRLAGTSARSAVAIIAALADAYDVRIAELTFVERNLKIMRGRADLKPDADILDRCIERGRRMHLRDRGQSGPAR